MEIKVKEKVVQNESVIVKTETTEINLSRDLIKGLTTSGSLIPFNNSDYSVEYLDPDLGYISVSFKPYSEGQAENVRKMLVEFSKLFK